MASTSLISLTVLLLGKPSTLKDENHPDWVPSQHLGHDSQIHSKRKTDVDRKIRADKRIKYSDETNTGVSIKNDC